MSMLRHNDDSVMAMLEAFVYDPLINWRLLVKPPPDDGTRARSDGSISTYVEGASHETGGIPEKVVSNPVSEEHEEAISHPASVIGTPYIDVTAESSSFLPLSASLVSASRRSRVEPVHHDERALNERAISVLRRVKSKLVGSDFEEEKVDVSTQVNLLVLEAQSNMNLCQLYVGWCAFW